mgnify:CR=1 FL=1
MLHSPRDIRWIPGRFSYGPTHTAALLNAYPHGGTGLGVKRAASLEPNQVYGVVKGEEYGGERVEVLDLGGEGWTLSAILRGYDDQAVALLFPNVATGTVSQHAVVTAPGTNRPGRLLAASGIVLVFTPDSPDHHPMVILHRAVALLTEQARMALSWGEPFEIPVMFAALRNSSGRAVSIGYRQDLTV